MLPDLQAIAPQLLGLFMLVLASVSLAFVWQDRRRRKADRARIARLRHEARVAERLRVRGVVGARASLAMDWLGETRR